MLIYGDADGWIRLRQIGEALIESAKEKDAEHVLWLLHIEKVLINQMDSFNVDVVED